ncbi:putative M48-family peptidase [Actinoplanes missouriensis 431]|uniref:Putative M48-family peptidase n=1 Tax=Actinoplanes missouriensis (strain ATCC 14538 / DSM 43046 / CBS 188.64 / JCM 3121 / NBRC 102363 / NCIMB 12654 / NRRL B-3342 / UNCC 431) TaxID=512565 RepID=I0GZV9_ACTM4|nr:M48 family metallopeptidase [Actinoplanes missouriensis]BAL86296.1 putative M48-family peptidase [Actinoplanes missouriensis 431]
MTTSDDANPPVRRRVTLTGISSRAWEHPADRGALSALRELRGFDDVVKTFFGMWNERGFRLAFLAGSIRVDHRQYPRVYQRFTEAAATLDVPSLPELYVTQNPIITGQAIGLDKPFIVISTGAVERLDDDELRALLGHELGHVGSGHAVYKTIMSILTSWAANLSWLPIGAIALRAIIAAMLEWWRKAELSADRAGLLAGQDPAASLRLLMKLAGGGDLSQIDTAAFLEQAGEYEGGGDLRDSLHKLGMVAWSTHPVPVARASELRKWIDSGEYARIIGGDYPRRDSDGDASVSEDVKEAAKAYRKDFAESQDPLVGLLRRVGGGASDMAGMAAGRAMNWAADARRRSRGPDGGTNGDANGGTNGSDSTPEA